MSSGTEHGRFGSPKAEPPKKKVAYEKQYHDGGASRFLAGPMQPDDGGDTPGIDFDLYYKCDTQNQWLPVPMGFIVVEDEEASDMDALHPFSF
jgi:hypothetical protein